MSYIDTPKDKARSIRLLVLDVDGVLTDGSLYFHADGSESKVFNSLDGHGIKMLQASGVEVAIITGRRSKMVELRAQALGIKTLFQGREDKLAALKTIKENKRLDWSKIAYCGDDLPDLAAIKASGLGITVPNAPEYMVQHADMCTNRKGGQGAVREVCDFIMQAQGTLQDALDYYILGC
ncbi:KdsC family phosphatase [Oceanospirillum linum]|uniref:3-deoxy-D-manno-octulosonate 8-phosphate phosphatase KdsC n=1 Tax=Oceanospirillum linum TaxID=966 RepID=A0A1T1H9J5_OCELI|nr:HAD hydrolase family protein [Oceanospirillum linum]OOV86485.1 HAD family hydrolase [Oceanospirillum linum]SEG34766.1 3-deoxy-D-manno-octulosonate 8-phosphate phosphatase (KDO 8-P phosphatase) [Oleiphilus messinensis]SMP29553.1 3-deoxy-D-manno-octulosonate 8-phosphate phosphatase (KDO 8-P phosphatase) [Oceanospirillum linum]